MPTIAARSSSVHALITGGTVAAPVSAPQKQLAAVLKAMGVTSAAGAYLPGKSQADLTREMAVPSIHSETFHRVADALGV